MSQSTPSRAARAPAAAVEPASGQRRLVALLIAYSFMTWFNRISMTVAYDERISKLPEHGIAPTQIGLVYSAFFLAYTVFMMPGGWFIDRFGPWLALVIMGFGSALLGALTGLASLPAVLAGGGMLLVLLLVRSGMGVLTAPVYPASSRIVVAWLPPAQRAWANGLVQGAAALGIACTFPLFGELLDWVDWPVAFVITGGITAVLALGWTVYGAGTTRQHGAASVSDSPPAEPRIAEARLAVADPSPWLNRSLWLLTLSYAAVGYVEYLFFHWVHFYFEDVLHLPKHASRGYAAVVTLAMAVGMMAGGWVADRLRRSLGSGRGRGIVPVCGLLAGAVLVIAGLLAEQTVWIVLWLSLALAAVGATEAPTWTLATELGGRRGGIAAAICNTGGNAVGLVAPIVTPLVSAAVTESFGVSELTGWKWAIALGSAVAVVGATLWFWITPSEPRHDG